MTFDTLEQELEDCLTTISNLDPTTEDYTNAVKNWKVLNDGYVDRKKASNEEYRLEVESIIEDEKNKSQERIEELKAEEAKKDRKANAIRTGTAIGAAFTVEMVAIFAEEVCAKILKSKAGTIAKGLFKFV